LLFRVFLWIHVSLYRLTRGKFAGQIQGLGVLILTTTGRKTGKARVTPLGHFEHDGGYVVIGSNGGSDAYPSWFLNLKNNPRATIQVNDQCIEVTAEITGPETRGQLWAQLIDRAPGYAAYAKKTSREIPVVILRPVRA
jgi:deazaflavin-dependent oxidoreductase (nitroreductase family)